MNQYHFVIELNLQWHIFKEITRKADSMDTMRSENPGYLCSRNEILAHHKLIPCFTQTYHYNCGSTEVHNNHICSQSVKARSIFVCSNEFYLQNAVSYFRTFLIHSTYSLGNLYSWMEPERCYLFKKKEENSCEFKSQLPIFCSTIFVSVNISKYRRPGLHYNSIAYLYM